MKTDTDRICELGSNGLDPRKILYALAVKDLKKAIAEMDDRQVSSMVTEGNVRIQILSIRE